MAKKINLVAENHKMRLKDYAAGLEETGNEQKASFMTEYESQKREIRRRSGISVSTYDLSILIGVEYRDLVILLAKGLSVNDIKKRYKSREVGEDIKLSDGQSLLNLCKNQNLDFTFMYRAIFTYKIELLQAIEQYKATGEVIPLNWINQKYGSILEQLGISGMQWQAIVKILQNNKMTLGEALESNIISRNAIEKGLFLKWGETVYGLAYMREKIGSDFYSEISINQKEREFISSCEQELLELKQKIEGDTEQIPNKARKAGGRET